MATCCLLSKTSTTVPPRRNAHAAHSYRSQGLELSARDGDIGNAQQFYFDDQSWAVRYLIADTGGWLGGRQVLISPYALDPARTDDRVIPVDLTKKQIENSPSLDTDKPVSRQYEIQYYSFFGGRRTGMALTCGAIRLPSATGEMVGGHSSQKE